MDSPISHYAKAIMYIAVAAISFLVTSPLGADFGLSEGLNLAVVVIGAVGVYLVPNLPDNARPYAKTGVALLTALAVAAISFASGGIVGVEWLQILLAGLAAVGVYVVPNGPKEVLAAAVIETAPVTIEVSTPANVDAKVLAASVAKEVRSSLIRVGHGRDADSA